MRTLSGVSFLQDAASELRYPILPAFLTVTLGAPVAVVGIVEGAAEGVAASTDGVGKAWIADLAPSDRTSDARGLHQAVTGGAVLIAGTWAGLAWNTTGTLPLILSGTSAAALAVLMATFGGIWKSVP